MAVPSVAALSARWFPFAFEREVPLSKSVIVVAKERRGGAFGQAGEFRSLFLNSLCSAQRVRHPSSHIQPGPAQPSGLSPFPTHLVPQSQGGGMGKSGSDRNCSWAVVCGALWLGENPPRRSN